MAKVSTTARGNPGADALTGLATAIQGGVEGAKSAVEEARYQDQAKTQRDQFRENMQFNIRQLETMDKNQGLDRAQRDRLQKLQLDFQTWDRNEQTKEAQRSQESQQGFIGGENVKDRTLQDTINQRNVTEQNIENLRTTRAQNYATKSQLDANKAEIALRAQKETYDSGMNFAGNILHGFGTTNFNSLPAIQQEQAVQKLELQLTGAGRINAGTASASPEERLANSQLARQILGGYQGQVLADTALLKERALNENESQFSMGKKYGVYDGRGGGSSSGSSVGGPRAVRLSSLLMPSGSSPGGDINDPFQLAGMLPWNYTLLSTDPRFVSLDRGVRTLDIMMIDVKSRADAYRLDPALQGQGQDATQAHLKQETQTMIDEVIREEVAPYAADDLVEEVRSRYYAAAGILLSGESAVVEGIRGVD